MTLNVKTLSALELVKALEDYPAEKYPGENQALLSEIRYRTENSPQRITEEKNRFGQEFIDSWPKKVIIYNVVSIVLLCIFIFQYMTGGWPLNFFLVVTGVMVNSYFFHFLRMKRQLEKTEVLERVARAESFSEVNKMLKASFIYRAAEILIIVLVLTVFLLSTGSFFSV